MLTFGERLKMARIRSGLTQSDVMQITHISDKSLSRYETDSASPDPETMRTLIMLYDVSADYILGLTEEMGHAISSTSRTSLAPPTVKKSRNAHDTLDGLSGEARKRAEDYLEMLKTLDEVKSGKNYIDVKKKA